MLAKTQGSWRPATLVEYETVQSLWKTILVAPQKIKQSCHIIQRFHFGVYTQQKQEQRLERVFVHPRSQQHYPQ